LNDLGWCWKCTCNAAGVRWATETAAGANTDEHLRTIRVANPGDLAEAERRCRKHADFLHVPGQDHLMLAALLAEYDRRGQIEQRLKVAAGVDVDSADWRACVLYIAGDTS
jgi:hypothetical protein